jgi:hypothetical protein
MIHYRNPYPRPRRYWFELLESIALGKSRLPALRKVAVEFVYTLERAPDTNSSSLVSSCGSLAFNMAAITHNAEIADGHIWAA